MPVIYAGHFLFKSYYMTFIETKGVIAGLLVLFFNRMC